MIKIIKKIIKNLTYSKEYIIMYVSINIDKNV